MIRKIRSLCVNILSRIVPATGANAREMEAKPTVHRRVEVTVERESVSVLVPGQPAARAAGTAGAKSRTEAPCAELPPAPLTASPTVAPATESPVGTAAPKAGEGKS
ncbi:MAG: hypothetical protein ABSF45_29165 [Terriglobia bacterium]|jgi:hypothetical protein